MTFAEAIAFALSLPEAVEAPHFEYRSFRVGGKIFATAPPEGDRLHVLVDEHAAHAYVSSHTECCAELWWGTRLVGVRVHLASADASLVCELISEAWRRRAPKRLTGLPG